MYGDPQTFPAWELWGLLKARINTPHMQQILRAGGVAEDGIGVYLAQEVPNDLPTFARPWGRVVIIPGGLGIITTEQANDLTLPRRVTIRGDANDFKADGYSDQQGAEKMLEAAFIEIYRQLDRWAPALTKLGLAFPFYVERPVHEYPQRDAQTGLLFVSAVYRCEVSAPLT